MVARFSLVERAEIEQRLVEAGEAAFSRLGLKHASIDMLAQAAGISKGAFYSFFDSKEALYSAVLQAQAEGVQARVLSHLKDKTRSPRAAFEAFLRALMLEYETNPVLRRLIDHPDELERVRRKAGAGRAEAKQALGFEPVRIFLTDAAEAGQGARVAEDVILGAVVLLPQLLLHKQEPGVGDWAPLEQFLITAIASAAFGPEYPSEENKTHGPV